MTTDDESIDIQSIDIQPDNGDVAAILEIDRVCFPKPWPEADLRAELALPQAHVDLIRRRADRRVLAFVNYWEVADEIHLLLIATRPEQQRRGHARRLVEHLIARGRQRAARAITLEVRRSNTEAVALYQSLGFRSVGVRPAYYADDQEDALLMDLDLSVKARV